MSGFIPGPIHAHEGIMLFLITRAQVYERCVQAGAAKPLRTCAVSTKGVCIEDNLRNPGNLFRIVDNLFQIFTQERLTAEDLQPCPRTGNIA
jgi:hypothetical protein